MVAASLAALPVHSKETALLPGEYITQGGAGVLTISKDERQADKFSLRYYGVNGHSCSLDGVINNGQAVLDINEPNRVCKVQFKASPHAVVVSTIDAQACRYFCGARAFFEDDYLYAEPTCYLRNRRKSQQRFTALYGQKAYQQALSELSPILSQCEKSLDWIEVGRIRNDIAITQYHLGQLPDCRATLEPLSKRAKSENELRDTLPPVDFLSYLPIARATWYNLNLCRKQ